MKNKYAAKLLKLLALVSALTIFLSSCNNDLVYLTLYRLNPVTGNITTVCADPTCTHNSPECPFYGFDDHFEFYIENDILYYHQYYTFVRDHVGELTQDDFIEVR